MSCWRIVALLRIRLTHYALRIAPSAAGHALRPPECTESQGQCDGDGSTAGRLPVHDLAVPSHESGRCNQFECCRQKDRELR